MPIGHTVMETSLMPRPLIIPSFLCASICLLLSGDVQAKETKKAKKAQKSIAKKGRIKDPAPELQRQCPKGIKVQKKLIERKELNVETGKRETFKGAEWACRSPLGAVYGKLVRLFIDGVRIEEHYQKGKRSGSFRAWHGNGKKKAEGQYKIPTTGKSKAWAGSKHGVWTHWYKDGKVQEKATYHYGDVAGKKSSWYPNGKLAFEESRAPGQSTGQAVAWWSNGQKRNETTTKFGQAHGLSRSWFQNGKKEGEATWADGKLHGVFRSWHKNGKKSYESSYLEGKQHGLVETWYANGKKKSSVTFKDGKTHGLAQVWHKNGRKAAEATYRKGKRVGKEMQWDEKGKVLEPKKPTKTRKKPLLDRMKDSLE